MIAPSTGIMRLDRPLRPHKRKRESVSGKKHQLIQQRQVNGAVNDQPHESGSAAVLERR
jgi:hypothetical protein